MGLMILSFFLLLTVVTTSLFVNTFTVANAKKVRTAAPEALAWREWKHRPEVLEVQMAQLQHLKDFETSRLNDGSSCYVDKRGLLHEEGPMDPISCDLCALLVSTVQEFAVMNRTKEDLVKVATRICITFKIEDERVCPLVVNQYKDMAFGVATRYLLTPDKACYQLTNGRCGTPPPPSSLWNLTLPNTPKPPVTPPVPPKPGAPRLRVVHLTDLHLDLQYTPGSKVECGEPLCCRDNDGPPDPGHAGAGRWGNYDHCDLPKSTVENLFQHLASIRDQFDMVYFTGDIPAHDVWNQTRSAQLEHLGLLTSYFRKYLPGVPVYSCPGNHESSPCNSYPPPWVEDENSVQWLYGALAMAWGDWLPPTATPTIMSGGFYSMSPFPGFRIISLNFNYGASDNWWLLVNSTDPADQLQWLIKELQSAEDAGEKVHILGHHPPGETMQAWGWNYYRIVNRYESTITGQFFGHTHKDSYQVFYDEPSFKRATNVAYVGGSATTYSYVNPGFRIYQVDGNYANSSWAMLDFTHYVADLSKVNNQTQLVWQKEYSPKEAYSMENLNPSAWSDLIYRMRDNNTLFNLYRRYKYKLVDNGACGNDCKFAELCNLKSARPVTPQLCNDLTH